MSCYFKFVMSIFKGHDERESDEDWRQACRHGRNVGVALVNGGVCSPGVKTGGKGFVGQ